jgi:hypothetical protein
MASSQQRLCAYIHFTVNFFAYKVVWGKKLDKKLEKRARGLLKFCNVELFKGMRCDSLELRVIG